MSAKKDIQQLVRRLVRQGWTAQTGGSGHWLLTSPEGGRVTCALTPRGNRPYLKARSQARRLGADV